MGPLAVRRWLARNRVAAFGLAGGLALTPTAFVPQASAQQVGTTTGLPVPRFVSTRSARVNLREGPSKDHPTTWIFQRAGLPVEVTAEFDTWRKIRDFDGSEGWVLHSLLSGRRTALVSPWKKGAVLPLYSQPDPNSAAVANLQAGVLGNIKKCDGTWCHIFGDEFDGFEQQSNLWGVYPGEQVD